MCIICIEFQRTKDLDDARAMLANARREPRSVDPEHLDAVERDLDAAARRRDASGG
jgi:hypothetical protein